MGNYLNFKGSPQQALRVLLKQKVVITRVARAHGGCISNGRTLLLDTKQKYFLKSFGAQPPYFFQAEADNLALLKKYSPLTVPAPLVVGEEETKQYLLISHIESGEPTPDYWERYGRGLATLHQESESTQQRTYGLDWDNWIGTTPQINTPSSSWRAFYSQHRLTYQINLAITNNYLVPSLITRCRHIVEHLNLLVPEPPRPSLVHGDLWAGNVMTDEHGEPALIDPAIYFGDREVDIAATMLFGRCDDRFYAAYNEHYPLSEGWRERVGIYNLYHLLNHLNIFGREYLSSVEGLVLEQLARLRAHGIR